MRAQLVNRLAVRTPQVAVLQPNRRRALLTLFALRVAVPDGFPARCAVRVRREGLAAPVGALEEAVWGDKADCLDHGLQSGIRVGR